MKYIILLFLLIMHSVFAAQITSVPDADIITDSWTTTPLFSKIDENAAAPDGTVITSPLNPTAANTINFSLTESVEGSASSVTIIVSARMSSVVGTTSLNLSWFKNTGEIIESINTGTLTGSFALYTGTFSVSVNRTDINSSFLLVIPSSTLPTDEIEIDAVNLNLTTSNTTLRANGTIVGLATNKTGENFTFQGSCEATGMSSATNVHLILQNSTDNITFSTISTATSEPVYANVSFYFIGTLTNANSSAHVFNINATKSANYTFRVQCNGTNTAPIEANSSGANFTANQSWGWLSVSLILPNTAASNSNVGRNMNFTVNGSVTCLTLTDNPTAICGKVNGTARYNLSGLIPDNQINTTLGDIPFWSDKSNQSCGLMNNSNTCTLRWNVNATGGLGRKYTIDVNFTSEDAGFVNVNSTLSANITITNCAVDFSTWGTYIDFGSLPPNKQPVSAPRNADNFYNITVNAGSCNTDLFIRGTDLTNLSFSTYVGVGNLSWSNVSNTYSTSANLTSSDVPVQLAVPQLTNVTTWYWIIVPPVFAGIYNGTITIRGVESV